MQTTAAHPTARDAQEGPCRYCRIERQYSSQRPLKEFVRDLLRAHSGE